APAARLVVLEGDRPAVDRDVLEQDLVQQQRYGHREQRALRPDDVPGDLALGTLRDRLLAGLLRLSGLAVCGACARGLRGRLEPCGGHQVTDRGVSHVSNLVVGIGGVREGHLVGGVRCTPPTTMTRTLTSWPVGPGCQR